jgi:hypothetical protein
MYNSHVKDHEDEKTIDLIRGVAWVMTMEKNLTREDYLVLVDSLETAIAMLKIKALTKEVKAA